LSNIIESKIKDIDMLTIDRNELLNNLKELRQEHERVFLESNNTNVETVTTKNKQKPNFSTRTITKNIKDNSHEIEDDIQEIFNLKVLQKEDKQKE